MTRLHIPDHGAQFVKRRILFEIVSAPRNDPHVAPHVTEAVVDSVNTCGSRIARWKERKRCSKHGARSWRQDVLPHQIEYKAAPFSAAPNTPKLLPRPSFLGGPHPALPVTSKFDLSGATLWRRQLSFHRAAVVFANFIWVCTRITAIAFETQTPSCVAQRYMPVLAGLTSEIGRLSNGPSRLSGDDFHV